MQEKTQKKAYVGLSELFGAKKQQQKHSLRTDLSKQSSPTTSCYGSRDFHRSGKELQFPKLRFNEPSIYRASEQNLRLAGMQNQRRQNNSNSSQQLRTAKDKFLSKSISRKPEIRRNEIYSLISAQQAKMRQTQTFDQGYFNLKPQLDRHPFKLGITQDQKQQIIEENTIRLQKTFATAMSELQLKNEKVDYAIKQPREVDDDCLNEYMDKEVVESVRVQQQIRQQ